MKGRKRTKETDMGGLLVNTMPAINLFSQCLLKASNTKLHQFQEDKLTTNAYKVSLWYTVSVFD